MVDLVAVSDLGLLMQSLSATFAHGRALLVVAKLHKCGSSRIRSVTHNRA